MMGYHPFAKRAALAVLLSTSILATPVLAEEWRDANRQSVELYQAGNIVEAAEAAERAAELYSQTDGYRPNSHRALTLQAAQMYDQAERYNKAIAVLRNTINHMEERYPEGTPTLTPIFQALSEMQFSKGELDKAVQARLQMIDQATKVYGVNGAEIGQMWVQLAQWVKPHQGFTVAKRYLDAASSIIDGNYDEGHLAHVMLDMELAKLDMERGDYNDAERKYESLVPRAEALKEEQPALVAGVYGQLAYLYNKTDRDADLLRMINLLAQENPSVAGNASPAVMVYPDMNARSYGTVRNVSVTFQFSVDEQGKPFDIRIAESSGNGRYEGAARTALERSRFVPGFENGKAVAVQDVTWNYNYEFPEQAVTGSRISGRT